jgi:hypothetical protein
MKSVHVSIIYTRTSNKESVTFLNQVNLQEIDIMSFKPSYIGQTRDELRFSSQLGWLATLAFAIVLWAAG